MEELVGGWEVGMEVITPFTYERRREERV